MRPVWLVRIDTVVCLASVALVACGRPMGVVRTDASDVADVADASPPRYAPPALDAPSGSDAPGADVVATVDAPRPPDASSSDAPSAVDAPRPPDAAAPPDASQPPGACLPVPALAADPTIDGMLDPGLAEIPLAPMDWTGASPIPPDQSAFYAVAWRPGGLYFYVRVVDPSHIAPTTEARYYCGDALELYVDDDGRYTAPPAFDNPGGRQFIIPAPLDAAPGTRADQYGFRTRIGPWTSTRFASYLRPAGGYVYEVFVTAADLGLATWTLAAGQSVGFDLSIDVSTATAGAASCSRIGQYFLQSPGSDGLRPFASVLAFCNPTLAP